MYYTYVLQSVKYGRLYVGSTCDLRQRLVDHNSSHVRSTKEYVPWKLLYYEAQLTKRLAQMAEIHYKTGQGRRQLFKKLDIRRDV